MAEFAPFDLGRVIQTAEAIKALRRQGSMDKLQAQYLGQQIESSKYNMERQQKADAVVLGKEKAQTIDVKASQILQAPNPKNYVEQNEPDLVKNASANGVDWATLDDDGVRQLVTQMQNRARQELGQGPLSTQQVGGFSVLQQGPKVLASQAPQKPQNAPQSYEEYVRAQQDPEFANFLKARKGKGLSVTLPDGTVVEMGGEGGKVGPGELAKPTINNLQETIVNSSNRLDRLNQLLTTYKPEYLQAKGLIKAGSSELKDFLGMDLSQENKQFLSGYGEFKASASQEFSATLKELSGTAASEKEVERVIKGVPSDKDRSPAVFEAKARATTKFITRAIMRANWALKNGIGVQSVDQLSKQMPLDGIDAVYESRANQLWQELGGTPETKAEAVKRANQEFGLAK